MSNDASRILFLFVDGLGVGGPDPSVNPLARSTYSALESMTGGRKLTSDLSGWSEEDSLYRAIDATLGVEGLPQSGTGQATLFTGVNCAELAGRHYGPFPHSSSRPVIRQNNLFIDAERVTGSKPVFVNAYPDRFFRYIKRTQRWTVTTLCCSEAGVPLKTGADLRRGTAVSADITGANWPEANLNHTVITPQDAGRRLTSLAGATGLTVFEYFETDKAGHSLDIDRAQNVLAKLDGLVEGVLDSLAADQTLVVTSDHGNVEDMSVKTHTRNPVPLLARGPAAHLLKDVEGLTDVMPAVLAALAWPELDPGPG